MQIVLIVLISLLLIISLTILILFLTKKNNQNSETIDKKDLQILESTINLENEKAKNEIKESLQTMKLEQSKEQNEKQEMLKSILMFNQNNLKDQVSKQQESLTEILTGISVKTDPIRKVHDKVDKLDTLLSQNNKAGKAAEYLLDRIFENITYVGGNNNIVFERQYKLKKQSDDNKSLIVDMFIKGNGTNFVNIPVDAKFPFNAYMQISQQVEGSDEYKNSKKNFETDVRARIKECAKYISSEDNTVYAVMFVPSEGIFSYLNEYTNLLDFAFNSKVIIAGPSTLMAIISSIDNYMKLFSNIHYYDKKIAVLNEVLKYISNYDTAMDNLFKTIESLIVKFGEVKIKENSLLKKYEKLLKQVSDDEIVLELKNEN